MSFEIVAKDLLGRIGRLKTKKGTIETPVLLPVVNPILQTISPKEMSESFGCRAVIANAYLLKKNFGDEVRRRGVHDFLGFEHSVVTDSGAYQILVYGNIDVTQEEIIAYQEEIDTDIGVILDVPTGGESTREKAEHSVEETLRRARAAQDTITRRDILWVGPVQGGNHLDLVKRSAREIAGLPFSIHALGSPTQVMENYLFDYLVDMTMQAKMNLPLERPFHLFGAGHPFMFALAVAMGSDIFDSAAYSICAREGKYFTQHGTERLTNLKYFPCTCRVCSRLTPLELAALEPEEKRKALARHNLDLCLSEIRQIKQAIREGRLWELLELRARGHPSLLQALKTMRNYEGILEENAPFTHNRGLFYLDSTGLARPEIVRHRKRLATWTPPYARILVLLPEPCSKPFHRTREFRRIRSMLRKRLGEEFRDVAFCVYAHPFGVVPLELDETYPHSQYETASPPDRETRDYVCEEVTRYIERNENVYEAVVVYEAGVLGEDLANLPKKGSREMILHVLESGAKVWNRESIERLSRCIEDALSHKRLHYS